MNLAGRFRDGAWKPAAAALLALLTLAPVSWILVVEHRRELLASAKQATAAELAGYAQALAAATRRRLAVVDEVESHLGYGTRSAAPDLAGFARLFASDRRDLPGLRSVEFVPDPAPPSPNRIREGRLRLELLDGKPAPLLAASRSITAGNLAGTVVVTFEIGPVVEECGLDHRAGVKTALRASPGRTLFGDPSLFTRDPVVVPVPLPAAGWQLAGKPSAGWAAVAGWPPTHDEILGALVILLACALVYFVAERYVRLSAQFRRHREHHRLVADALPALLSYTDAQGNFRFRNRAHLDWFGAPDRAEAAAVLGETVLEKFRQAVNPRLQESEIHFDIAVPHPRLGERELQCIVIPSRDGNGEYRGVYTLAVDITGRKRAEAELKRSRDIYLRLFDESPSTVWVTNPDGTIAYVNKAWLQFAGIRDETEAMAAWLRSLHPEDFGRVTEAWTRASRERAPLDMEYRVRRHDGEYRWVQDICKPVYDTGGAFAGFIGVVHDLTERKNWERVILRFQVLVENARDIVLFVDGAGAIIEANHAAEKAYGYPREELISLSFEALGEMCWTSRSALSEASGEGLLCESIHCRRDGSTFPVEIGSRSVLIQGERVLLCIIRDITERKKADAALRLTQFAMDHAADAAFWIRQDGSYAYVNDAACRALGYSRAEFSRLHVWDVNPAISPESWAGEWAKASRVIADAVHRANDGTCLPAEISVSRFEFEGAAYNCVSARYVGDRKRAETALKEAHATLRAVVQAAPAAMITQDASGRVKSWNAAAERMFGWSESEVLNRPCPLCGCEFESVRSAPVSDLEKRFHDKLGRPVDVNLSATPLDPTGEDVLIMMLDISARTKADAVRRQHERNLLTFLDGLPAMAYSKDLEGKYTFLNRMAAEAFGRDRDAAIGLTDRDLFGPEQAPGLQRDDQWVIATGQTMSRERVLPFQGRQITIHGAKVPLRGEDGTITGVLGVAIDITARKAAEQELRRSEARFRRAIREAPVPIMLLSSGGKVVKVNRAFSELTGYTEQTMPHAGEWMREPWDSGPVERSIATSDGKMRVWQMYSAPLESLPDGSRLAIVTAVDITENKRLQAQLASAQKMEAVGRLAGGIAHDFNNVLTVIKGYSDLLLEFCAPDHPFRPKISSIQDAARRAASLVDRLLAFSRRQWVEPVRMDVNTAVAGMESMLRRLIGEHIRLILELGPEAGAIEADPVRIEQVVLNLAINARDAMPGGGVLTVKTWASEVPGGEFPDTPPARFSVLSVIDTGIGMDEQIRAHIFEPFFSTKEVGKGTGLGLATVYGIVEQAGGHLRVESELGKGTRFDIFLPRVSAAPAPALPPQPAAERAGATETVLVVEDEAPVRAMVCEALSARGFSVIEARDPQHALTIAREHEGEIHAAITDIVMPGMNGLQLADLLLKVRPRLVVLFISGYPGTAPIADARFLQKPFTPVELISKLREAIAEARPEAN